MRIAALSEIDVGVQRKILRGIADKSVEDPVADVQSCAASDQ
jgi:hypothetical protein